MLRMKCIIPVLPVAVWRKSRHGGGEAEILLLYFMTIHIILQLIKTNQRSNTVYYQIPMRTKVKIVQHNRLDANSFSVKLWKQTKNCGNTFDGSNKNFMVRGFYGRTAQEFLRPKHTKKLQDNKKQSHHAPVTSSVKTWQTFLWNITTMSITKLL